MPVSEKRSLQPSPSLTEPEVVLAEFNGDAFAAIEAQIDLLTHDAADTTSRGYLRGHVFRLHPTRGRNAER